MPAKMDRCVTKVTKSFVDKYVKKNGKQPSAKKRKEFKSSAYGVCTNVGKKEGWFD
jgi:hypothetical protein